MAKLMSNNIEWLNDFIRLEIALWDRVNARLHRDHDLSLAFFEALYNIEKASDDGLRVGDLARALRITVGAASKLADRVDAAGLIRRQLDADDRRASRLVLTDAGSSKLAEARVSYAAEVSTALNAALTSDEQHMMHSLVTRLLAVADEGGSR